MSKLFEEVLREELVPASLRELRVAMEADEGLKRLLTTKGKDLPREYWYLVREMTAEYEEKTLLDLIDACLTLRTYSSVLKCFFSKAGDKIVGFAAYMHTRKEVSELKIFTLEPERPNPVLYRDLKYLLKKLVEQYEKVSWIALAKNPANRAYERAIKEFGGTKETDDEVVYYTIAKHSSTRDRN